MSHLDSDRLRAGPDRPSLAPAFSEYTPASRPPQKMESSTALNAFPTPSSFVVLTSPNTSTEIATRVSQAWAQAASSTRGIQVQGECHLTLKQLKNPPQRGSENSNLPSLSRAESLMSTVSVLSTNSAGLSDESNESMLSIAHFAADAQKWTKTTHSSAITPTPFPLRASYNEIYAPQHEGRRLDNPTRQQAVAGAVFHEEPQHVTNHFATGMIHPSITVVGAVNQQSRQLNQPHHNFRPPLDDHPSINPNPFVGGFNHKQDDDVQSNSSALSAIHGYRNHSRNGPISPPQPQGRTHFAQPGLPLSPMIHDGSKPQFQHQQSIDPDSLFGMSLSPGFAPPTPTQPQIHLQTNPRRTLHRRNSQTLQLSHNSTLPAQSPDPLYAISDHSAYGTPQQSLCPPLMQHQTTFTPQLRLAASPADHDIASHSPAPALQHSTQLTLATSELCYSPNPIITPSGQSSSSRQFFPSGQEVAAPSITILASSTSTTRPSTRWPSSTMNSTNNRQTLPKVVVNMTYSQFFLRNSKVPCPHQDLPSADHIAPINYLYSADYKQLGAAQTQKEKERIDAKIAALHQQMTNLQEQIDVQKRINQREQHNGTHTPSPTSPASQPAQPQQPVQSASFFSRSPSLSLVKENSESHLNTSSLSLDDTLSLKSTGTTRLMPSPDSDDDNEDGNHQGHTTDFGTTQQHDQNTPNKRSPNQSMNQLPDLVLNDAVKEASGQWEPFDPTNFIPKHSQHSHTTINTLHIQTELPAPNLRTVPSAAPSTISQLSSPIEQEDEFVHLADLHSGTNSVRLSHLDNQKLRQKLYLPFLYKLRFSQKSSYGVPILTNFILLDTAHMYSIYDAYQLILSLVSNRPKYFRTAQRQAQLKHQLEQRMQFNAANDQPAAVALAAEPVLDPLPAAPVLDPLAEYLNNEAQVEAGRLNEIEPVSYKVLTKNKVVVLCFSSQHNRPQHQPPQQHKKQQSQQSTHDSSLPSVHGLGNAFASLPVPPSSSTTTAAAIDLDSFNPDYDNTFNQVIQHRLQTYQQLLVQPRKLLKQLEQRRTDLQTQLTDLQQLHAAQIISQQQQQQQQQQAGQASNGHCAASSISVSIDLPSPNLLENDDHDLFNLRRDKSAATTQLRDSLTGLRSSNAAAFSRMQSFNDVTVFEGDDDDGASHGRTSLPVITYTGIPRPDTASLFTPAAQTSALPSPNNRSPLNSETDLIGDRTDPQQQQQHQEGSLRDSFSAFPHRHSGHGFDIITNGTNRSLRQSGGYDALRLSGTSTGKPIVEVMDLSYTQDSPLVSKYRGLRTSINKSRAPIPQPLSSNGSFHSNSNTTTSHHTQHTLQLADTTSSNQPNHHSNSIGDQPPSPLAATHALDAHQPAPLTLAIPPPTGSNLFNYAPNYAPPHTLSTSHFVKAQFPLSITFAAPSKTVTEIFDDICALTSQQPTNCYIPCYPIHDLNSLQQIAAIVSKELFDISKSLL